MNQETPFDLSGRVAIVTGGARGIGRGIGDGLARAGASIVIADVSLGGVDFGGAVGVEADVSDLAQHGRIVAAALDAFGRIDILVNNAGIGPRAMFLDATEEAWERTVGVNLKAAYFLSQAVARHMLERRSGKIINISSVHDTQPMTRNSIYCVTKAGVAMLTKSLALELAEHNIQVNAIAPGAIRTDINREVLADADYHAKVLAKIPARRIGEPEDIAGAALLFASSASDYITGATLYVDGGMILI